MWKWGLVVTLFFSVFIPKYALTYDGLTTQNHLLNQGLSHLTKPRVQNETGVASWFKIPISQEHFEVIQKRAIQLLGHLKDRRALPRLKFVAELNSGFSENLRKAAQNSIQEIQSPGEPHITRLKFEQIVRGFGFASEDIIRELFEILILRDDEYLALPSRLTYNTLVAFWNALLFVAIGPPGLFPDEHIGPVQGPVGADWSAQALNFGLMALGIKGGRDWLVKVWENRFSQLAKDFMESLDDVKTTMVGGVKIVRGKYFGEKATWDIKMDVDHIEVNVTRNPGWSLRDQLAELEQQTLLIQESLNDPTFQPEVKIIPTGGVQVPYYDILLELPKTKTSLLFLEKVIIEIILDPIQRFQIGESFRPFTDEMAEDPAVTISPFPLRKDSTVIPTNSIPFYMRPELQFMSNELQSWPLDFEEDVIPNTQQVVLQARSFNPIGTATYTLEKSPAGGYDFMEINFSNYHPRYGGIVPEILADLKQMVLRAREKTASPHFYIQVGLFGRWLKLRIPLSSAGREFIGNLITQTKGKYLKHEQRMDIARKYENVSGSDGMFDFP